MEELASHKHTRTRGVVVGSGVAQAPRLSQFQMDPSATPPEYGAHTEEVLRAAGVTYGELDSLESDAVIRRHRASRL